MNPKQFLQIGGAILILLGILGFVGVIGPTSANSIFHNVWWFDNGENWTHLILGAVALIAAFALNADSQKPLVMVLGIVGVLVGLYSAFVSTSFFGVNLENPADTILHIVVGVWALWASFRKSEMPSLSVAPSPAPQTRSKAFPNFPDKSKPTNPTPSTNTPVNK